MADKSLSTDGKSLVKSQTIQGNILSILATIGTVATLVSNHVPYEVLVPAVTAAGGAVWGNLLSIFGRIKATEQVKTPGQSK